MVVFGSKVLKCSEIHRNIRIVIAVLSLLFQLLDATRKSLFDLFSRADKWSARLDLNQRPCKRSGSASGTSDVMRT
jgi:hypothetical protein